MLTVFVDPGINDPEQLLKIVSLIKKRGQCRVVCFFNPYQSEFLKCHNIDAFSYGEVEWPLQERNEIMERIMQGFNDQYLKPYSTINISLDGAFYKLNVFRFLSANAFLKNLILPIAKTFKLLSSAHPIESGWVIGDPDFIQHMRFCLKAIAPSEFTCLNRPHKVKRLASMQKLFRSAIKFIIIGINRFLFSKKRIVIPAGQMTNRIIADKQISSSAIVIKSLDDMVLLYKEFEFKAADKIHEQLSGIVREVINNEKKKFDLSIQFAYDIWSDFLTHNYLKQALQDCIATIRALRFTKPAVVVQYNFNGNSYPMKMWCDTNQVKTLSMQHGLQGRFAFSIKYDIESDIYYTWAELPIDMERNQHVQITCGGNPNYSSLNRTHKVVRKSDSIRKILIAPTGLPIVKADADWAFWSIILDLLAILNNEVETVIKFHHKDRFKGLVKNRLKPGKWPITFKEEGITELIEECDLIITTVSTVALDAFSVSKPVIIVNNAHESEYFSNFDACPILFSAREIADEIRKISSSIDYYNLRIMDQNKFISLFCDRDFDDLVRKDIVSILKK